MFIVIKDGTKIKLPKYYRDKIFTDEERAQQAHYIQKEVLPILEKEESKKPFHQQESERKARLNKLNKKKTKNKDL